MVDRGYEKCEKAKQSRKANLENPFRMNIVGRNQPKTAYCADFKDAKHPLRPKTDRAIQLLYFYVLYTIVSVCDLVERRNCCDVLSLEAYPSWDFDVPTCRIVRGLSWIKVLQGINERQGVWKTTIEDRERFRLLQDAVHRPTEHLQPQRSLEDLGTLVSD